MDQPISQRPAKASHPSLVEHLARMWSLSLSALQVYEHLTRCAQEGAVVPVAEARPSGLSEEEADAALAMLCAQGWVIQEKEGVRLGEAKGGPPGGFFSSLEDGIRARLRGELAGSPAACTKEGLDCAYRALLAGVAGGSEGLMYTRERAQLDPAAAETLESLLRMIEEGTAPSPLALLVTARDIAERLAKRPAEGAHRGSPSAPLAIVVDTNVLIAALCPADHKHELTWRVFDAIRAAAARGRVRLCLLDQSLQEMARVLSFSQRWIEGASLQWLDGGTERVAPLPDDLPDDPTQFLVEFLRERRWGSFLDYTDAVYRRLLELRRGGRWSPLGGAPASGLPSLEIVPGPSAPGDSALCKRLQEKWPRLRARRLEHDAAVLLYAARAQQDSGEAERWVVWTHDELLPVLAASVREEPRPPAVYYLLTILRQVDPGGALGAATDRVEAALLSRVLQLMRSEELLAAPSAARDAARLLNPTGQEQETSAAELRQFWPRVVHRDEVLEPRVLAPREFQESIARLRKRGEDKIRQMLADPEFAQHYVSFIGDIAHAAAYHGTSGLQRLSVTMTEASPPEGPVNTTAQRLRLCPHSVTHMDLPWALVDPPEEQRAPEPPEAQAASARAPTAGEAEYQDDETVATSRMPAADSRDGRYVFRLLTDPRGLDLVLVRPPHLRAARQELCARAPQGQWSGDGSSEVSAEGLLAMVQSLAITDCDLRNAISDPSSLEGALLLIHTEWSSHMRPTWLDLRSPAWEGMHAWNLHPWLTDEAVKMIMDLGPAGVAVDAPMPDCPLYLVTDAAPEPARQAAATFLEERRRAIGGNPRVQPVHNRALRAGLILLEAVAVPEEVDGWYQGASCVRTEAVLTTLHTHLQTDCAFATLTVRRP